MKPFHQNRIIYQIFQFYHQCKQPCFDFNHLIIIKDESNETSSVSYIFQYKPKSEMLMLCSNDFYVKDTKNGKYFNERISTKLKRLTDLI